LWELEAHSSNISDKTYRNAKIHQHEGTHEGLTGMWPIYDLCLAIQIGYGGIEEERLAECECGQSQARRGG